MNPVAEEILMHYGMPKRSGRYPWGSGDDPYQHGSVDFLSRVSELKKQNFTFVDEDGKKWTGENAIAKSMGLSIKEFRNEKTIANDQRKMEELVRIKSMREKGMGYTAIGKELGKSESSIRSILDSDTERRIEQTKETIDFLKKKADEKGMIDVGAGVNKNLNISEERLELALYYLDKKEGYPVYGGRIPQPTNPTQQSTQRVLCVPGTKHGEIYNYEKVHSLDDYISRDDGKTFEKKFHYPESLDSSRLKIRYNEEGGIDKDGIVELRRGVKDLSLGESKYSQVRILVDGTHYIKGMAVYSDDLPDGVDVVFNTNKSKGTPMTKVLKPIKDDPNNPFGSLIKDPEKGGQYWYDDPKTGEKKLGLINKRADEGDWSDWSDSLPSQFLGKQSKALIDRQLKIAKEDKEAEYASICELNNPTIKKHYLQEFADSCDAAAVNLKAAALPGQKYHVIIPVNTLKDNEVYAPGYENGTKLALVRYPHGGTFEIPVLTVNNKHGAAKKLIGNDSIDAVGINKKIADQLSGADFDGDTVMAIPTDNGKVKITRRPYIKELEGFDPKIEYSERKGMKYMSKRDTQLQMGIASNLITDMTLQGAGEADIAKAVKHSMVVIDAEKHKLDYKRSEADNNISALKKKWQVTIDENGNEHRGGASTILSKAGSPERVIKRQGSGKVNIKGKPWYDPDRPEGAMIYEISDKAAYTKLVKNRKTGQTETVTKYRTQDSTKMAETDDAYTLVSAMRHPKELAYADYANSMKSMANKARVEIYKTDKIAYSKNAKDTYKAEVKSLEDKLDNAEKNRPREREALRRANVEIQKYETANPTATNEEKKKYRTQAMNRARADVGSIKRRDRSIPITEREWEAIQAGAISESKLQRIINNTDPGELRKMAMPKQTTTLNRAQITRAKKLADSDYTLEEIAKKMGKSPSTISQYLKKGA